MTITDTTVPDFDAVKQRQQAAWASGDFAVVAVGRPHVDVERLVAESFGLGEVIAVLAQVGDPH